jgi:dipeptidyl aminopeptidase/acylaminoacyl peptidase
MFFTLIRITLRAALMAGVALLPDAALIYGTAFSLSAAQAQPAQTQATTSADRAHIEDVLKGLSRGHTIGQVAISPDGQRLAWIEQDKEGAEMRVAPLGDLARSERVTAAAKPEQHCHEGQIVWAPDTQSLVFFSDCAKPGQSDLYMARQGSPVRRLTELKGYVEAPAFSPDGTRVAFLYVEGATRPAGALAAMKPPSGVIGEVGVEIERVAVVRVDAKKSETTEWATPANLHVYEFDWRPDGQGLAYLAADPPGENNWWVAKLYTQELNGEPKAILAPSEIPGPLHGLQIAVPRWSPDGKQIAFIGGLMSDQGATGGDVWIISSAGGQPVDLTPQRPASPVWIEWDGNRYIYISELAGGDCRLVHQPVPNDWEKGGVFSWSAPVLFSVPGAIGDGRMELSLSSTADHSLFVFLASTFNRPVEIYVAGYGSAKLAAGSSPVGEFAGLTQLSHLNDGVQPAWGKSVSLTWKSGKFDVQGWLTLPKDYDPAKRYPLIVEVHGGPASAVVARWNTGALSAAAFSALGYFVLQPNPRGSFGQGEEFTQANRKDFGYGDLRDILAGVDAVEAAYPVDPNRVGLAGWSYGGFMAMFAVTQTHRFKAAVAGAGISNWQSYYGENSIDQWMTPYFGASVYDDPQVYAKSSAINFIKNVTTPTLIVVGERDGECPAPQSYEFWHALRSRHVPTQLVVYPNEGHMFADPGHRRDVMERTAGWFARYLPPEP